MALSAKEGPRLVRKYGGADRWLAVLVTAPGRAAVSQRRQRRSAIASR